MLNKIPKILSPELVKVLMEMGHGDEICLGDGNFPHTTLNSRVIRCDGLGVPELFNAILTLMPLDVYVEKPVVLMAVVPGDTVKTPIWETFRTIVGQYDARGSNAFEIIDRFAFYERARHCIAVVATSEQALYANVILKKGVVVGD